ncbi:MAG: hypothetical protein F4Y26_11710 [Gammaproteobacteria bacterium]|nr:hypothetical protein [Gammaproteobacteria bacterium]
MQPVAAVAVVVFPRPLKELPVHLDAGGVDEQRNVALRLHLVVDDRRRDPAGELNGCLPQTLHVARPHAPEPLPRAARLGHVAKTEQGAGHRVGAQRIEVGERPVAAGQRRDDGPQRLGVGCAAVPDLHRNRLVEELEEPELPGGLRQDRGSAEGGQIQIGELELDPWRADFSLLQRSPAK